MDKFSIPNKLPSKQVAILAHRRKRINKEQGRITQKRQAKRLKKYKRFIKPETLIAEYRKAERDDFRMKREAQVYSLKPKTFVKDGTKKLILAFRYRGNRVASQNVIKLLRELKLTRKYHAAFLKVTETNLKLLAAVEPYVAWGYPSIQTVRDLIFKYGFTKAKGKKTPISSNQQVEEVLGEKNIICIEDLVHEIFTVGPQFEAANKYLCQFVLQAPKTGWEKTKGKHFSKGGECGFRGDAINDLFQNVL